MGGSVLEGRHGSDGPDNDEVISVEQNSRAQSKTVDDNSRPFLHRLPQGHMWRGVIWIGPRICLRSRDVFDELIRLLLEARHGMSSAGTQEDQPCERGDGRESNRGQRQGPDFLGILHRAIGQREDSDRTKRVQSRAKSNGMQSPCGGCYAGIADRANGRVASVSPRTNAK